MAVRTAQRRSRVGEHAEGRRERLERLLTDRCCFFAQFPNAPVPSFVSNDVRTAHMASPRDTMTPRDMPMFAPGIMMPTYMSAPAEVSAKIERPGASSLWRAVRGCFALWARAQTRAALRAARAWQKSLQAAAGLGC